jgi:putative ABC transport system ATP-binding protein
MADEPTASLDSQSGHGVIELLRYLAKEGGCTVLMVTHDPRIIDVADRIAYLEDGVLTDGKV